MYFFIKPSVLFLYVALLLCPWIGKAQEQVGIRTLADRLFQQAEYYSASKIYLKLVDNKKPRAFDIERLAECYYQMNEYGMAHNWYARVMDFKDFKEQSQLNYVDVLRKEGDYALAKQQLLRLKGRVTYHKELDLALQGIDSALYWMDNPTRYNLVNQELINTRFSEFGGFPLSNGILYSGEPDTWSSGVSGRTGRPYLRAYSASVDTDGLTLQYPSLMPESFNDVPFHIAAIIADKDQNTLYVTRTYAGDETERRKTSYFKFQRRNLELLIYKKEGTDWVETPFLYNSSKEYSLGHAALSDDEQTLYFVSNMPGGLGGTDIWFCELQEDGNWGPPINAGAVINSAGDELFPYVFGNKIYYASNGFVGMGGLDVYMATGARNNFANQQNLGFPINSAFDDFAFIPVGDSQKIQYGYVSSDRVGGVGLDDIYAFTLDKPRGKIFLEGYTRNQKDEELIGKVEVALTDKRGQLLRRLTSDVQGAFYLELDDDATYYISGYKEGFHRDSVQVHTAFSANDTTLQLSLRLQPIMEKGISFVLENIYYDLDKYAIRADAKIVLNQLVKTLRDNPGLRIELSSHTDSRGASKYNQKLSQQRAQAAVDFVVEQGISRNRLVAKGYGESRLLNRCKDGVSCSDAEHQINRRTEIKVLDF